VVGATWCGTGRGFGTGAFGGVTVEGDRPTGTVALAAGATPLGFDVPGVAGVGPPVGGGEFVVH
jgi:hypothetical protein